MIFILGIIGAGITIGGTYAVFEFTDSSESVFYSNYSVNICLYSIAIFGLSKSVFSHREYGSACFHKTVRLISKHSLVVYAVHVAVIEVITRFFPQVHALITILSTFTICTIVSVLSFCVIS